jgi:peptide/nickel transport system substrate-binding protein
MVLDPGVSDVPHPPASWVIEGTPIELEQIDDFSLRFSAPDPMGRIEYALCDDVIAYPKHVLRNFHPRYNPKATYQEFRTRYSHTQRILSPGIPRLSAWIPVEWIKGQRIVCERNPYYWKVDTKGNQLPYADRLEFLLTSDPQIILLKFLNGELDLFGRYSSVEMTPSLRQAEKNGEFVLRFTEPDRGPAFYLNWDAPNPLLRGALRNRDVRIALSIAINREEINHTLYYGLLQTGGYSFSPSNRFFSKTAFQTYAEYNPERAASLLDLSGYIDTNDDGVREFPDGSPFQITIDVRTEQTQLCELILDYWTRLGIKVHLFPALRDILLERRQNGRFEVLAWPLLEGPTDPLFRPHDWAIMHSRAPFWHRNASTEGPAWLAEATDHMKQAMVTFDPDELRRHMTRIRDLHSENIPVIAIGCLRFPWGANTRVGNVPRRNTTGDSYRGWSRPLFHEQLFIRSAR